MKYPKLRINIENLDLSKIDYEIHPELIKLEEDFSMSGRASTDTFILNEDSDAEKNDSELEDSLNAHKDEPFVHEDENQIKIRFLDIHNKMPIKPRTKSHEVQNNEILVSQYLLLT